MRTIKIFLASSEELAEERIRFGDFIRQLDDMYEVRDYRIKLYKWEDLPSGDNGKPKHVARTMRILSVLRKIWRVRYDM